MLLLAVVKDEKLVKHVSFDLDHFTQWNSVPYRWGNTPRSEFACGGNWRGDGSEGYGRTSSSSCRDSMSRGSARDSLPCSVDLSSFVR